MIKKFVAWVKALFGPAKIEISDVNVDEYIAKQQRRSHDESDVVLKATVKGDTVTYTKPETVNQVRFTKAEERPLDEPLKENEVRVGINIAEKTAKVVTVETRSSVRDKVVDVQVVPSTPESVTEVEEDLKKAGYAVPKSRPTPPKPLDEQLKGVELPTYAQGKKLPPKAKRQYIDQAKRVAPRKMSDNPASYGNSQVNSGIDPVNAAVYGYAAATILSDDTPSSPAPAPVEECRSSSATSTYSSSYSSSDDSYSSSSYSSSSSSYDSSSYDSGSSSSSCD